MPSETGQVTDEDLANSFLKSDEMRLWRETGARFWELPIRLRTFLRTYTWLNNDFSIEFEKTLGRVQKIVRSRWAQKAAKTRHKNDLAKRQGSFDFIEQDS